MLFFFFWKLAPFWNHIVRLHSSDQIDSIWTASFFRVVFWARTVPRGGEAEEIRKVRSNCSFAPINIYCIPFFQAALHQTFVVWFETLKFCGKSHSDMPSDISENPAKLRLQSYLLLEFLIWAISYNLTLSNILRITNTWASGPLKSRSHVPALSWSEVQWQTLQELFFRYNKHTSQQPQLSWPLRQECPKHI